MNWISVIAAFLGAFVLVCLILYWTYRQGNIVGSSVEKNKWLENHQKNERVKQERMEKYIREKNQLATELAASRHAVRDWVRKMLAGRKKLP